MTHEKKPEFVLLPPNHSRREELAKIHPDAAGFLVPYGVDAKAQIDGTKPLSKEEFNTIASTFDPNIVNSGSANPNVELASPDEPNPRGFGALYKEPTPVLDELASEADELADQHGEASDGDEPADQQDESDDNAPIEDDEPEEEHEQDESPNEADAGETDEEEQA